MGGLLDSLPDDIKRFKPAIRGGFITNPSPNSLLDIEARLVRWKVLQLKTLVGLYESSNLLAFMPCCAVHMKPDLITLKAAIEMSETSKEPFSISLRTSQHSTSPQKVVKSLKNCERSARTSARIWSNVSIGKPPGFAAVFSIKAVTDPINTAMATRFVP